MEVNRPQQKLQTSRKGKKAWRKNIDIDEVEQGLEQTREDERLLGKDNVDGLFTVDTTGDDKIKSKYGKEIKTLKSTEILQQRSKVPALNIERNKKKIEGVSKKEVHRLMKLAGKVQGETQMKTIFEKDGILNTKAERDLWGSEDSIPREKTLEIYEKASAISYKHPSRVPKTLKQAPIQLKDDEIVPHAGKSYNPSLESWEGLISYEFKNEKEKEDKRISLEKEKERVQNLIENFDDKGELSSDDDDEAEEEEELEEDKESGSNSLSINAPTENKKKTKAQRNKEKRNKERQLLENELKELKLRIKEIEKLPEIISQIDSKPQQTKSKKRKSKLFKYENIDRQLEVKLSDELTDSLRSLKPEGNLLYDEMMKLQNNGKIESRKIVYKKRRYLPKITEKWTYKDFK